MHTHTSEHASTTKHRHVGWSHTHVHTHRNWWCPTWSWSWHTGVERLSERVKWKEGHVDTEIKTKTAKPCPKNEQVRAPRSLPLTLPGFICLTEWRMCGQVLLWCSCPFSKSAFTVVTSPTHGHTSLVSPLHDVNPSPPQRAHTNPYCIVSFKPMAWLK